jgi:hypothetical protein
MAPMGTRGNGVAGAAPGKGVAGAAPCAAGVGGTEMFRRSG